MSRVLEEEGGGGGEWEEGWGRGHVIKGLHAHEHISAHRFLHGQCWLEMLAESIWRATMSIPADKNLLEESLRRWQHANDPLES